MSKYSQGDHVRVTDPKSYVFDQVGVICRLHSGDNSRWIVDFNGALWGCVESTLTLADPDVHTVLNQMDAESGIVGINLPRKGMDEREIDGEVDRTRGMPAAPFDNDPLNVRSRTLRTAEDLINGDRADAYGDPQENFGRIAALLNAQFSHKLREDFTAGDVAIVLTHLKLSRLANTPDHADSFVDACGYLALGSELAARGHDA